ncbi:hypothetical protein SASPL_147613 [Salvia splendens]|uniref:Uncharacterized protein n=1 Tax=Salvia splendens TaxID=180675 RepID=A0A8X8Z6V6_SALSN|nr:hypothetical protein SASPL_147613 [Salvia splendens]
MYRRYLPEGGWNPKFLEGFEEFVKIQWKLGITFLAAKTPMDVEVGAPSTYHIGVSSKCKHLGKSVSVPGRSRRMVAARFTAESPDLVASMREELREEVREELQQEVWQEFKQEMDKKLKYESMQKWKNEIAAMQEKVEQFIMSQQSAPVKLHP